MAAYFLGDANSASDGRLARHIAIDSALTLSGLADMYAGVLPSGITSDHKPSAIQLSPGQWLESENDAHALIPEGMSQGQYKTQGQLRGSNTWSADDALQYIGADFTLMPANAVFTLYAKASVSADFNIGDQTDADRYAAAETIGTEWEPVATLKQTSDGTNRKLTITPTASYTGTVETMWKIEIVK